MPGWKTHAQGEEKGLKELNERLEKAESELKTYELEIERKTIEEREKMTRLATKKKKERHWEMMKWIVDYIEAHKKEWNIRKIEREREQG